MEGYHLWMVSRKPKSPDNELPRLLIHEFVKAAIAVNPCAVSRKCETILILYHIPSLYLHYIYPSLALHLPSVALYLPFIWPSFVLKLPFTCPSFALNLPFTCTSIAYICPSFALHLPFICPSFALHLPFICPSLSRFYLIAMNNMTIF